MAFLPVYFVLQAATPEVLVVSPRDVLAHTVSEAQVTVLTAADLARTGERSLPRAIGRAAGVFMLESNLGGGSPTIRGLLGNQVLIVVDGVRLNDSTTRFGPNQSLNTIDPAIVERVEVRRGPGSVQYGSDAIGGVIAIWTRRRRPQDEGDLAGALEALYDSSTRGARGALELSGAGAGHGVLGVGSGARWGDLVAGGGDEVPSTGYDTGAGFGSAEFRLDPARTLRAVAWLHRDFDVPRTFQVVPGFGQTEPSFARYDFALQEREQATLTLEDDAGYPFADRVQVRLFARSYREQRLRRRTGSTSETFGETDVDTVGVAADFVKELTAAHRLTFGFELAHDDVDSFNVRTDLATGATTPQPGDFAPGARYETFGAFVQDETRLAAPVLLTLGLRWSRHAFAFDGGTERERGAFDQLTASAVAAWEATERTRFSATLAQGFQAPNLEDLANDGDFAGGTELANPDLDPAEALTAELAVETAQEAWRLSAAAFGTRIDDTLGRTLLDVGDPAVSGDELYMRANAGRVDLWGAELALERTLGGPASPWVLDGRAAWVRGRQYDGSLGGPVDARRVPPLFGELGLAWRAPVLGSPLPFWFDGGRLACAFALEQDQLHPDDVLDPRIDPTGTDGWTVWSLEVGGELARHVRWQATLVNLLDEGYRAHGSAIDGPGRSIVLSVRAGF